MFNDYIWKIYLDGKGKEVVDFFQENLLHTFSKEYADKICEFHKAYCPCRIITESLHEELVELCQESSEGIRVSEVSEYTIEAAITLVYDDLISEEGATPQTVFNAFSGNIAFISTLFAGELPDLFVPYYFTYNFNIFERIAREFNIDLPEIPVKKDYKGRFLYYGKICEALYGFRKEHNMSPWELCAFLYDFAPKYVGGIDSYIIKELPTPKSAYFIGGSKYDAFLSSDEDAITPWQCNPDTLAGDVVVMYLKTPISAVDSVWRSVSVGFNDPFFYYYRCTYIAKPCKINMISQKQLKEDSVFKELPIIKKNMQGVNGVELYPSVYNHLLDMAKSDLPKLEFSVSNDDLFLSREVDVENKLIKPLLAKLGYSENEYKQQLYIEIGNHNHALIPDFVIHPIVSRGHQSGDFLVEAKFSISSDKLLEEAKTQARGYAKLLNAGYSVIASKEGIWVTSDSDDYTSTILTFTWDELNNEDTFHDVYVLLGNGRN